MIIFEMLLNYLNTSGFYNGDLEKSYINQIELIEKVVQDKLKNKN